jgi:DNA-binding CsgD family transcriptional regulator
VPGVWAIAEEKAAEPRSEERAAELARELARSLSTAPARDGVLLDVNVGDVRCVVVRNEDDTSSVQQATLSPREREIARMVALGYTNKTIARVLDISVWTVSTHLRRIFGKLGVSNRAATVAAVATVPAGPAASAGSTSEPVARTRD